MAGRDLLAGVSAAELRRMTSGRDLLADADPDELRAASERLRTIAEQERQRATFLRDGGLNQAVEATPGALTRAPGALTRAPAAGSPLDRVAQQGLGTAAPARATPAQGTTARLGLDRAPSAATIDANMAANPDDSWGTVLQKRAENIDDQMGRAVGGIIEAFPQIKQTAFKAVLAPLVGPQIANAIPAQAFGMPLIDDEAREVGRGIAERAGAELERNAPNVSGLKQYAYDLTGAMVDLGLAVGASAVTRSPTVGSALLGARTFGDRYAQSIEGGRTEQQAMQDGVMYGFAEMVGESAVIGNLIKPGVGFVGRVVRGGLGEGMQEMVTQTIQTAYDAGVIGEKMTVGEAMEQIAYAGLIGAGAGAGVGAVSGAVQARSPRPGVIERAQQEAPALSEQDIASPTPNQFIEAGRKAIAASQARSQADQILQQNGLPYTGQRVTLTDANGNVTEGTIEDAFTDNDPELGEIQGVKIKRADGRVISESFTDLADAGVVVAKAAAAAPVAEPAPVVAAAAAPANTDFDVNAYMGKNRVAESGGDDAAKARTSSATGRYQFTDGTWLAFYSKTFGDTGESPAQILAKRFDGATQDRVMATFTRENVAAVERAGAEATEGNVYLAHFLGQGGASAVLRADPNTPVADLLQPGQISANKSILEGKTAGDVIAWAARKMGGPVPANLPITTPRDDEADNATPDYSWMDTDPITFEGSEPAAPIDTSSPLDAVSAEIERQIATPVAAEQPSLEGGDPAVAGRDMAGEQIDDEWTAFAEDSGSLRIPRAEMPQIKAENRGAMVNFLKARGVTHEEVSVPAAVLKPTQAEFSRSKVQKAKDFEGGNRAILVSSDGHVLDGHHQWLAARDNGEDVRAIMLDAPIAELLPAVAEMPSATTDEGSTAAPRNVPKSPAELGIEDARRNFTGGPPDVFTAADKAAWNVAYEAERAKITEPAASSPAALTGGGGTAPAVLSSDQSNNETQPGQEVSGAPAANAGKRSNNATPQDMLTFIAKSGGLSLDGLNEQGRKAGTLGHDLGNSGFIPRFVPRAGAVLKKNGRSLDEMGELLWDAGYFGPPATTPRPTDAEIINLLDETGRTKQKRYSFFDQAPEPKTDKAEYDEPTSDNADLIATMRAWLPEAAELAPEVLEYAADIAVERQLEIAEALAVAVGRYVDATIETMIEENPDGGYGGFDAYPQLGIEDRPAAPGDAGSEAVEGDAGPRVDRGEDAQAARGEEEGLDRGEAVDPAIADRQRQEAQLRSEAPMRARQEQDGTMGLGLFDANDQPDLLTPRREPAATADVEADNTAAATPTPPPVDSAAAVSPNTVFTEDAYEAAKRRMRERMGRLNAGVDPEMLFDGMVMAGYHLEKGARKFATYADAMIADLGAGITPYLRSFYEALRYDPRTADWSQEMSGPEEIGAALARLEDSAASGTLPAQETVSAALSDSVYPSDEPAGAEDVSRNAEDRSPGGARGSEGGRGTATVQPADRGSRDAAERGAEGSGGRASSGRAGVRDADRVPAARRDGRSGLTSGDARGRDWTIEPGSLAEDRGAMQKARDNVDAIEAVKRIEAEDRPATREEQAVIARYVGWGGLKNIFPDPQTGSYGKGFEGLGARLRELLTDAEYETANRSIQWAHYTGETVVRSMWDIAAQLGFRGGRVFEPGMGTGNFRGMMPAGIASASQYHGIEYDHLTASIAKLLYPQSGVRQADYTETPQVLDAYDLVIGNPPFAETSIKSDPVYGKHGFLIHDFFFAKSLDAVKPGGLLMFVTSAGTMNKIDTKARDFLAARADLVGAIRLPGGAFEKNAGTKVTTDIVILRKRLPGEAANTGWTQTRQVTLPDRDGGTGSVNVSSYFLDNPDMILGEHGLFDELVSGLRYGVRPIAGQDIGVALKSAAERLPANILGAAPSVDVADGGPALDLLSDEKKDGSFYVSDGKLMQYRGGVGREVQGRGKGKEGGMSVADQERVRSLVPVKDALRAVYAADIRDDKAAGDAARKVLNKTYDAFVKKFGPINKTEVSYRAPTSVQLESARASAREEARLAGREWDDGSFNIGPLLERGASIMELARERKAAREAALAAGRTWDEGSFDPDDVPDSVVEKFPNIAAFIKDDEEGYRLAAIEHYNKDTGQASKGRAFTENAVRLDAKPEINSAQDALLYSLNRLGRPDIALMADMAGLSRDAVLEQLAGQLFEIPGSPGVYETAETYLAGNVVEKLATARDAAEKNPGYRANVTALEAAQPVALTATDVSVNLGMPWIQPEIIQAFALEKLGLSAAKISYLPKLAQWTAGGDTHSNASVVTWGTARANAMGLLESALNRQTPKIYDNHSDGTRSLNVGDTQAAQDKLAEIKQAFRDWIFTDEARTNQLVDFYNANFNTMVAPKYDGTYLTTPGIASGWSWRPHQRAVIARIVQAGNTYMAHEVGAGKTSAMIGAGMEMKRLGLVNKPMYVVPNHMLGQFTKEFYEQYPLARIRVADEQRFHTSRRKDFIARIAADDLDAVIITHSAFGYIPMSDAFTDKMIQDQIDDLAGLIAEMKGAGTDTRITRRKVEQQKQALEQKLKGMTNRKRDQVFTFEETGIDFLFVDEAHLFRKLNFSTKMGDVKGIDPNGSSMSFDLYAKTRYLESQKPGRNLVLASGTPITNTMAELYSVSRYLQEGELRRRGLAHFDAWAGAFGDTVTALEQDATGAYVSTTRFAKFVNVPELSVLVRQVMDVVGAAELRQYVSLPTLKGGSRQLIQVDQTPAQEDYRSQLQTRMELIKRRTGKPEKGDDIVLSVINDGRKAAIDYRLVDPSAPREEGSKLERMIEEVARRHKEFAKTPFHQPLPDGQGFSEKPVSTGPGTQMIFSNFGINGDFPVQKYIRNSLVQRGVKASEIAIISDFKSHVAKQRLFNDVNEGKVRVLIGSVAKMGTGVNAQRRLRAIHNMDALWFPADDTQRNGRGIRQGNMNPEIEIVDYATNGTYDSAMWSMMARKGRFIEAFFRGDPTLRDMEDLGEASQFEQAAALTTSDPRIMQLTEWKQELEKIERRRGAHEREQHGIRTKIAEATQSIERSKRVIPLIEKDIAARSLPTGEDFKATVAGKTYDNRAEFGAALLEAADAVAERAKGRTAAEKVAKIAGFTVEVETRPGFGDGPAVSFHLLRAGERETRIEPSADSLGMAQRVVNALRKFDAELSDERYAIAQAERYIADFSQSLGKPFDGGANAGDLRRQIDDLEATLAAETRAAEEARNAQAAPPQPEEGTKLSRTGGMFDEPTAKRTAADLKARLEKVGIDRSVVIDLVESIFGDDGIAGSYQANVITIALRAQQDQLFTLNHEIIHALKDLGLFKPAEWTALRKAALANPALMADVGERYPDLDAEAQIEEAIADRFAAWAADNAQERGFVASAFRRVAAFFKALGEALRGNFTTAESVMRAIEGGEVADRAPDADAAGTERLSRAGSILARNGSANPATVATITQGTRALVAGSGGSASKLGAVLDDWRTAAQDRMLPLLRAQSAVEKALGRTLTDSENAYRTEELMSGKVGAQMEKLAEGYVEPLFEALRQTGITVEELESFLYARHAPERNAQIAAINPEFAPGEGSGMSDIEAAAILARVNRTGRRNEFDNVAAILDALREETIRTRVDAGLMSQDQADEWAVIYPNYVPLRGMAELSEGERPKSGQGVTVRGKESKRAFGRRSKAEDIIAYSIMQAEEAIIRARKNDVAKSLHKMAEAAPDPDFWTIDKVTHTRKIDPETGLVKYAVNNQLTVEDADWTVSLKIDGTEHRVTFNRANPEARKAAEAMRRLNEPEISMFTKVGLTINRWLSTANTSLNPEFVITNAFRDLQTALTNVTEFDVEGMRRGMIRDYVPALIGVEKALFGKDGGEWGRWWREFTDAGGRVSYNQVKSIDEQRADIESRIARMQRKAGQRASTPKEMALDAWGVIQAGYGVIDRVNMGVENAIRLAAYKNAREAGMSKDRAASLAKNLTVNFNRRGSRGTAMNALYLFYNASVQGTFRVLTAMKHRKVRQLVYGMVATGAAMELLNMMASGVDDDDEPFYDKIPDFDKSRNLIIMEPGGSRYVKIPLPYGFNAFYATGRATVEAGRGKRSKAAVMGELLTTYAEAFNPVGGAGSLLNLIAPTVADPVVDLALNRDFADRPIMPEQSQFGPQTPDNQRYWGSINPIWKNITDGLNKMTGGDEIVPGAIDMSPETLDYMFGVVTGAAGSFLDRSLGSVIKLVDDDPETTVGLNDVPFARKIIGTTPEWYDKGAFYERLDQIETTVGHTKDYIEAGDRERAREYANDNAEVIGLRGAAKAARKAMRSVRSERAKLEAAHKLGKISDERLMQGKAALAEREAATVTAMNKLWNGVVAGD